MNNRKVFICKNLLKTVVVCIFCFILAASSYTTKADPNNFMEYMEVWQQQKLILLDPGHGGMDGGGVSKEGILEKDINLKIALKTKELLEREGYKVIMTRDTDTWLCTEGGTIRKRKLEDLANRYKMKKESGCDAFISIHLNKFPQSKYYGAQVWYGNNDASRNMARILQKSFRDNLDPSNERQEKPAGNSYTILKDNGEIPAVIAECGFLSNPAETEKLCSPAYQEKIGAAIVIAVNEYFGTLED
jgi:N-acetylmuramoyl-L-alanine amidase